MKVVVEQSKFLTINTTMKKSSFLPLLAAVAFVGAAQADISKECTALCQNVTQQVSAQPEQVVSIVSEQVAAKPEFAGEIVKAAIIAAKADKDLVGEIVFAAVTAAPEEATIIAECAIAAAPEAAETIKSALRRSRGGKNPVSYGKNPSKNPKGPIETPVEGEDDFGLSPVNIGGVYLIYPGGASSTSNIRRDRNGNIVAIGPDGRPIRITETIRTITRPGRRGGVIVVRDPGGVTGT
jgi:hypothetical protein